jgi:hypothetical protein
MKILTKFMATTAVLTLIAGGAVAQATDTAADPSVGAGVEADTSASVAAGAGEREAGTTGAGTITVTGQTAADPTVGAGVEGQTGATVAAGASEETAPAGTAASPGVTAQPGAASAMLATTTDRLGRGERVEVVSQDGVLLGYVNDAHEDERGAASLSIALEPTLETNAENVTFIGLADFDADGRIVLPYAQEDFVSQIQAQFGDQG